MVSQSALCPRRARTGAAGARVGAASLARAARRNRRALCGGRRVGGSSAHLVQRGRDARGGRVVRGGRRRVERAGPAHSLFLPSSASPIPAPDSGSPHSVRMRGVEGEGGGVLGGGGGSRAAWPARTVPGPAGTLSGGPLATYSHRRRSQSRLVGGEAGRAAGQGRAGSGGAARAAGARLEARHALRRPSEIQ